MISIALVCQECSTPLVTAEGRFFCGRCRKFRGQQPAVVSQ